MAERIGFLFALVYSTGIGIMLMVIPFDALRGHVMISAAAGGLWVASILFREIRKSDRASLRPVVPTSS